MLMQLPDNLTILGLVAGCCTTFALVPQVSKAWRSRSTKDLSLGMFLTTTVGIMLWLIYATIRTDLPLVLANIISLMLVLTVLVLKQRHG
jgi:MtN3 and saliva related transmembrane protein